MSATVITRDHGAKVKITGTGTVRILRKGQVTTVPLRGKATGLRFSTAS